MSSSPHPHVAGSSRTKSVAKTQYVCHGYSAGGTALSPPTIPKQVLSQEHQMNSSALGLVLSLSGLSGSSNQHSSWCTFFPLQSTALIPLLKFDPSANVNYRQNDVCMCIIIIIIILMAQRSLKPFSGPAGSAEIVVCSSLFLTTSTPALKSCKSFQIFYFSSSFTTHYPMSLRMGSVSYTKDTLESGYPFLSLLALWPHAHYLQDLNPQMLETVYRSYRILSRTVFFFLLLFSTPIAALPQGFSYHF